MVLELCELLGELAERRASALSDCSPTIMNNVPVTNQSNELGEQENNEVKFDNQSNDSCTTTDKLDDESNKQKTTLKFLSEAQRYLEIVIRLDY